MARGKPAAGPTNGEPIPADPAEARRLERSAAERVRKLAGGLMKANGKPAHELNGVPTPAPPTPGRAWPAPLAEAAFHGPLGELTRVIEPATEADPAAVLFQALVAYGNLVGPGPFYPVEAARHRANEFLVVVGRTSKARKGTSWQHVRSALAPMDEEWGHRSAATGSLSSGEGLVAAVRDPGKDDPGVADKRLLVVEGEFANVLKATERQGNTLSAVLRNAWDGQTLGTLTKNNQQRATGAHISVVGHITQDELHKGLTSTEMANGFINRFLVVAAQRSKELPDGGEVDERAMAQARARIAGSFANARHMRQMSRDAAARDLWHHVYGPLSGDRAGIAGFVLGRAEAHVTRLANIYALADGSSIVGYEHLTAALACWRYVEDSVRHVFGDATGDRTADSIREHLAASPAGLTRTDINNLLGRNLPSQVIDKALGTLVLYGYAKKGETQPGKGRPAERWFCGTN